MKLGTVVIKVKSILFENASNSKIIVFSTSRQFLLLDLLRKFQIYVQKILLVLKLFCCSNVLSYQEYRWSFYFFYVSILFRGIFPVICLVDINGISRNSFKKLLISFKIYRDEFRIQSNIYGGGFAKIANGFQQLNTFAKKLHHICLIVC